MPTAHAAEQVFFKDPAIDRLMGVTMALATARAAAAKIKVI